MTLFFIILLFAPTTTERPMFFPRRRVATYSYAYYFFFFTYVMIQSAFVFYTYYFLRSIRILVDFVYVLSIHASFVTLLLLCTYGKLRRVFIHIFTSVFLHGAFPLVYVWIIATYSYTLLHVRISSLRLPLCVRIFLHAYSSSSVCFLPSFVLSRHRHCRLPFFFFALELTQGFVFYLRCYSPSLLV